MRKIATVISVLFGGFILLMIVGYLNYEPDAGSGPSKEETIAIAGGIIAGCQRAVLGRELRPGELISKTQGIDIADCTDRQGAAYINATNRKNQ